MNLKTITARTMAEALKQVQIELGSSAVILHTRTYQRGGILGIGAKTYVEVTAADGQAVGRQKRQAAQRAASNASRLAASPRRQPAQGQALAGDLIKRTYAAARAEFQASPAASTTGLPAGRAAQAEHVTATSYAARSSPQVRTAVAPLPSNANHEQLAEEMRAVKRMVAQVMRQQHGGRASAVGRGQDADALIDHYMALIKQEVAEELADEIIEKVRNTASPDQLKDTATCRKLLLAALAEYLPADEAPILPERASDGRPRTIALVGPTGVGKTTTIAKLAATFKIKQGKHVGLITLDTYRIAAVEQLRTYAGIIGLPLQVATTPDELKRAIQRCAGCDVILIDTAGRSQRDNDRLDELAKLMEAANPHEIHLVLSSTCTQPVLLETIERFAKIRTDRIIFTKLDEAVTCGVLVNVARKVNKKLSYITTGQEVPHQIEPGQSSRLAAMVLGEGGAKV